jgi:hypothetical protein
MGEEGTGFCEHMALADPVHSFLIALFPFRVLKRIFWVQVGGTDWENMRFHVLPRGKIPAWLLIDSCLALSHPECQTIQDYQPTFIKGSNPWLALNLSAIAWW